MAQAEAPRFKKPAEVLTIGEAEAAKLLKELQALRNTPAMQTLTRYLVLRRGVRLLKIGEEEYPSKLGQLAHGGQTELLLLIQDLNMEPNPLDKGKPNAS